MFSVSWDVHVVGKFYYRGFQVDRGNAFEYCIEGNFRVVQIFAFFEAQRRARKLKPG